MRTYTDCFICLMKLALNIARRTGSDEQRERVILEKVAGLLPSFSLEDRPPEMALIINNIVKEITGVEDPFAEDKKASNRIALRAAPRVRKMIRESQDPLLSAIEYAIAGNSIDIGANHDMDIDTTLQEIIQDEKTRVKTENPDHFQLAELKKNLDTAETVLYITDNSGEIVFDMLLIEILQEKYPMIDITVAVRNSPIINDATMEDAEEIGLTEIVRVISSGCDTAGTLIPECTKEFMDLFYSADMVIGKGQGNFETLSDIDREVFLLFKTKCPVIARYTQSTVGDIMLIKSERFRSGNISSKTTAC